MKAAVRVCRILNPISGALWWHCNYHTALLNRLEIHFKHSELVLQHHPETAS